MSRDQSMLEASIERAGAAVAASNERKAEQARSARRPDEKTLAVSFTADEDTCKRILAYIAGQPTRKRSYRQYEAASGEREAADVHRA